ncbi:MAG: hypothetical protein FWE06_02210 [Oscillospiraceae bacterium]|nr:hypothetical protein [Oscillospiraceae bacterium]
MKKIILLALATTVAAFVIAVGILFLQAPQDGRDMYNNFTPSAETSAEITELTVLAPPAEVNVSALRSALTAYRDFLQDEIARVGSSPPDEFGNETVPTIRYARLIDFDNSGIPELLLRWYYPAGVERPFLIFRYNGEVEQIYQGWEISDGGDSVHYETVVLADGESLLVGVYSHTIDGFNSDTSRAYLLLVESDEFMPALIGSDENYELNIIETHIYDWRAPFCINEFINDLGAQIAAL